MTHSSRLALGTVQFGLKYGVNNTNGQVAPQEVAEILSAAHLGGIRVLDTAHAYGTSEQVLGETGLLDGFRIVTKFPAQAYEVSPREIWQQSLTRLGQQKVYGYLLHNFHSFRDRLGLVDFLQELRSAGHVEKTGFSLYEPSELMEILDRDLAFEMVQIPFSLLDQRFAPLLGELRKRKVEVHVRSAFLQGLVFKNPADLHPFFASAKPNLVKLNDLSVRSGLAISDLCLGYCLANPEIDHVVIGVDSSANLKQNLVSQAQVPLVQPWLDELSSLRISQDEITNPAKWKLS